MSLIRLPITAIRLDESTQIRAAVDDALIEEYAAAYRHEESLPPPEVFGALDDETLPPGMPVWIGDGHTRVRAALRADLAFLTCSVRPGGEEEAFAFALTANRKHGARLTNADKRNAVRKALLRWHGESDREIARRAEVDHKTVSTARGKLSSTGEIPQLAERKGADGRARALPKKPEPAAVVPGSIEIRTAPPVRPFIPTLFAGAPDTGEPVRTAGPGAQTIVVDGADSSSSATGIQVEKEEGSPPASVTPPMAEQDPAGGSAQVAGAGTDPEDDEPAPTTRRAAAKATDPYSVEERIALLRLTPYLRGIPEGDVPAVAAALREMADGLAADPAKAANLELTQAGGDWMRRAETAEARVVCLTVGWMAQAAGWAGLVTSARERGDNMEERWGEAQGRVEALEAQLGGAPGPAPAAPATESAAPELVIEREPDAGGPTGEESQERRPPRAKAKPTAAPAPPPRVGDQVLVDRPKGPRRAVVGLVRADGQVCLVLRADPAKKLKATTHGPCHPSRLTSDPALGDRAAAIREAIDVLEGMALPPEEWIEALRGALAEVTRGN